MLSLEQGTELVKIAREAIMSEEKEHPRNWLNEKRGIFVTVNTYPDHVLRGCIGFPYPERPLIETVKEAARAAAFGDPRFLPVDLEKEEIVIEVSVLSEPERLDCKPEERPEHIVVGKHGIIVKKGMNSGLLLPQVAVEYGMTPEEFLSETCLKAGLEANAWIEHDTRVYVFSAQVFAEKTPEGKVEEIM